jgi:hypothetical protein
MKMLNSPTLKDFNPSNKSEVDDIKAGGDALINYIKENCPEGREASIAITNIEQGCMWAVKSLFVKKD